MHEWRGGKEGERKKCKKYRRCVFDGDPRDQNRLIIEQELMLKKVNQGGVQYTPQGASEGRALRSTWISVLGKEALEKSSIITTGLV